MSYALLTLPNVSVRTADIAEVGTLGLECVSDQSHDNDVPGDPTASLSLLLRLNAHSFLVERGRPVSLVIAPTGERVYTFEAETGEKATTLSEKRPAFTVRVVIPPPSSNGGPIAEDIETFDHLLAQYGDLAWSYGDPEPIVESSTRPVPSGPPPPLPARSPSPSSAPHKNIGDNVGQDKPIDDPSLRGRLVLMDEANGEVVGELPQSLNITEDAALRAGTGAGATGGSSTAPVVLEMDAEMYDACTGVRALTPGDDLLETREVFARAVPPEEQDWLMKSATFISQAISGSTSLFVSGVAAASNFYIAHSSPATPSSKKNSPNASGTSSPVPPTTSSSGSSSSSITSPPQPQTSPSLAAQTSRTALSTAYTLSGHARAVSAKTADVLEGVIRRAVGAKPNTNPRYTPVPMGPSGPTEVAHTPPPAYAVYTPKHRPSGSRSSSSSIKEIVVEDPVEEEEEEGEKKKVGTKDRLLLSANLVLTTLDDSTRRVFDVTTGRFEAVMGHKFGPDAQQNTHLAVRTVHNVVLVYVDVRGFARRALITKTGKEFVKARFSSKDKDKVKNGNGDSTSPPQSGKNSGTSTPRPGSAPPIPPRSANASPMPRV